MFSADCKAMFRLAAPTTPFCMGVINVCLRNVLKTVKKCLVEEFGVPATMLRVDVKGGVDNMFYNDPALSRAVIIK